ncbi:MAG: ferritin-like domain-containing protein [Thermoleophilia bacterium]|nr:ferritin-like domain-containing protein [Thermoleophilia bacterium]
MGADTHLDSEIDPASPTALQQLERDSHSREKFLKTIGGAGAAAAFGILLAGCGSSDKKTKTAAGTTAMQKTTSTAAGATDSSVAGDLDILNYALTLEYLEAGFYAKVIESGLFKGKSLDLIKVIGSHENEHVAALTATVKKLGGTPAAEPNAKFPLESAASVLALAATVENLGASAYLGQAGNIVNPEVLAAALAIHTVEARHASALNVLTGKSPTPDGSFAKPATKEQVLAAVKPFIVA